MLQCSAFCYTNAVLFSGCPKFAHRLSWIITCLGSPCSIPQRILDTTRQTTQFTITQDRIDYSTMFPIFCLSPMQSNSNRLGSTPMSLFLYQDKRWSFDFIKFIMSLKLELICIFSYTSMVLYCQVQYICFSIFRMNRTSF